MRLTLEELTVLRTELEDALETAQAHREHVLEEDDDVEEAIEIVDREAILRGIHKKVCEDIKGGGE